jgi:hypothetical protein
MGKIIGQNIPGLSLSMLLICMLLCGQKAEASTREMQLFDQAYHLYLSYQPAKAIEQFRLFLVEFPDSSLKDAALFWLAKSLIQVQSPEEAKVIFGTIRQNYPGSPFMQYVTRELSSIGNATEVRDPLRIAKNGEPKGNARTETNENAAKADVLYIKVRELEQREIYIANSAAVLDSLGIDDVPWRSNNILEDIENEDILYEKAISMNISADSIQQRSLAGLYTFNREQTEYLNRFLVICLFLTMEIKEATDERVVESIMVEYQAVMERKDSGYDSSLLASELQTHARNGMPLEDMHALYPDKTKFNRCRVVELEAAMKEKIADVQDDGTGIFWTERGFMIIRLLSRGNICNPQYRNVRDKAAVKRLIAELRGERKRVKHADQVEEKK